MNIDHLIRIAALESQRDAALAEADRYCRLWAAGVGERQQEPGTPDDLDALARRMDRARAERAVLAKAKAWRVAGWNTEAGAEAKALSAAVDALEAAEAAEKVPDA